MLETHTQTFTWTTSALTSTAVSLSQSVTGAILVPWIDGPHWEVNTEFVDHVRKATSVNRPVVLICCSGNRSADAARALEEAGSTKVHHVVHGFEGDLDEHRHRNAKNGCRHDGLPWEQF